MADNTYTGAGSYSHTFDSDTNEVEITLHGGEGGDADDNGNGYSITSGDPGSEVYGRFDIADLPSTIEVRVAGNGGTGDNSGGYNGGGSGYNDGGNLSSGGGGGASDIRDDGGGASTRYLVAGGGGGGGATAIDDDDATRGASSGHTSGDSANTASTTYASSTWTSAGGGGGGDQSSGGGGYDNGSFGAGGDGDPASFSGGAGFGGGGGGGYYGGGGGHGDYNLDPDHASAGGGGGGSDYAASTALNTSFTSSTSSPSVSINEIKDVSAPTSTSQSISGDTSIPLSWTGDPEATSYRLEVSIDGGSYQYVADTSNTSYTYSAAASANTLKFRVRSENSTDTSAWDYTGTKKKNITAVDPGTTGTTTATISWELVDEEDEYRVLRATSSGATASDYTEIARVAAGTASYDDSGLDDNTTYYYRVEAVYSGDNSLSTDEAQLTTDLIVGSVFHTNSGTLETTDQSSLKTQ